MYIARFNERTLKVQSVREHTLSVANLCKIFGRKLNISSFLYLAGLLHDMGKYSVRFQDYIELELKKVQDGDKETDKVADKEDHGVLEVNLFMRHLINAILLVV